MFCSASIYSTPFAERLVEMIDRTLGAIGHLAKPRTVAPRFALRISASVARRREGNLVRKQRADGVWRADRTNIRPIQTVDSARLTAVCNRSISNH